MANLQSIIYRLNKQAEARALSSLVKSAKFSWEMNDKEKAEVKAQEDAEERKRNIPKRREFTPTGDRWQDFKTRVGQQAKSLGIGAANTLGITGIRAAQGGLELALWLPKLGDKLIFGSLGVNNGRGFLGEPLAWVNRYADKAVHKLRSKSQIYDYENDLSNTWVSKLNRAAQGGFADAAGSFIGYGGLGALTLKGLLRDPHAKIKKLPLLFGGFGVAGALTDGAHKQLRENEYSLWKRSPATWRTYDPTGTRTNISEGAYTPEEYQKYYLPAAPTAYSGRYYHPWAWTHSGLGTPVQFRLLPGQPEEEFQ